MKDTEELHLFEATLNTNKTCTPKKLSICQKTDTSDSAENKFACYTESAARKNCAEIGRQVCGTCVSHLYESYDK
ncbi:MAG: hypothetical protein K9J17_09745 [Flavobacteriales bacterium]|nr:hypothetical protein [Flavobacteriales bacterium]